MSAPRRHRSPSLFFFRQFLRAPSMVGSVIPTSRAAIRALLDPIDWSAARCVVEYGPGTGVFTRALLKRLRPDARLIAIDTNPDFTAYLRETIADRRLVTVDGSAADIEKIIAMQGFDHADYVISGLPFSTIPRDLAHAIMDATARAVRPGGAFLVYQYSLFVLPMLAARFSRVDLDRAWRCIPPARLFRAWREVDLRSVQRVPIAPEIETSRHREVEYGHDQVVQPPTQPG